MSELQWALLVVGALAVIAIYFFSRREGALKDWTPPSASDSPLKPKPPSKEQMDMFQATGEFDELGVGRPRSIGGGMRREPALSEPAVSEPKAAAQSPKADKKKSAGDKPKEKLLTLLIAEREGTAILGPKLHEALRSQQLEFGARQIYHRMEQGMVLFSVASLVKPGTLDPTQAQGFSTPGLSMFMTLPGAIKPMVALEDMLATARGLARSLNAEVFDVKRQVLSDEAAKELRAEVENWARANHLV